MALDMEKEFNATNRNGKASPSFYSGARLPRSLCRANGADVALNRIVMKN